MATLVATLARGSAYDKHAWRVFMTPNLLCMLSSSTLYYAAFPATLLIAGQHHQLGQNLTCLCDELCYILPVPTTLSSPSHTFLQ